MSPLTTLPPPTSSCHLHIRSVTRVRPRVGWSRYERGKPVDRRVMMLVVRVTQTIEMWCGEGEVRVCHPSSDMHVLEAMCIVTAHPGIQAYIHPYPCHCFIRLHHRCHRCIASPFSSYVTLTSSYTNITLSHSHHCIAFSFLYLSLAVAYTNVTLSHFILTLYLFVLLRFIQFLLLQSVILIAMLLLF